MFRLVERQEIPARATAATVTTAGGQSTGGAEQSMVPLWAGRVTVITIGEDYRASAGAWWCCLMQISHQLSLARTVRDFEMSRTRNFGSDSVLPPRQKLHHVVVTGSCRDSSARAGMAISPR